MFPTPAFPTQLNGLKKSVLKRPIATLKANPVPAPEILVPEGSAAKRRAGRPKNSGKYGEPTKAVRFPVSLIERMPKIIERNGLVVPLYSDLVQAGYPSPAENNAPFESFDLCEHLVPNPASTFFIRTTGESMRDAGIFPGDVLIVDRSLEASNGDVVVACVNGEFTVKRFFRGENCVELRPENDAFKPIVVSGDTDFLVWGVVKTVLHYV